MKMIKSNGPSTEPCVERDGIDGLDFNLDFAYFRNAVGLRFIILATFCSKTRLSYLVNVRREFLQCIYLSLSYLVFVTTYVFHSLASVFFKRIASLVI